MSDPELGAPVPEGLLNELYEELRALAARHLMWERADHTLEPTALVHEAFLRLTGHPDLVSGGGACISNSPTCPA